jgi:hypothetical protein
VDRSDCCLGHQYVNTGSPNTALVYAVAVSNMSYYLWLGCADPHDLVNHIKLVSLDPVKPYGACNGCTEWEVRWET